VTLGLISQEEADEVSRAHRAAGEAGYAFAAVTVFRVPPAEAGRNRRMKRG
jgi:hypothetical protein